MGNACINSKGATIEDKVECSPGQRVEDGVDGKSARTVKASGRRKLHEPGSDRENSSRSGPCMTAGSDAILSFLSSSWAGSILSWSNDDLQKFAGCLDTVLFKDGEDISTSENSFFIIVEGAVEVHAILPTISKKTQNIREFLCRKGIGDMLYMESVKAMVSDSNLKVLYEKETFGSDGNHSEHKSILNMIDTLNIKSVSDSTLLKLDWNLFEDRFGEGSSNSTLDVEMLRKLLKTNLADYLKNIPVFEGLPQSKLELLSRLCHYSVEHEGATICKEGEDGEEVFILLSGEVKVEAVASKRMVELFEKGVLTPFDESSTSFRESDSESEGALQRSRKGLIKRRRTLLQARHHVRRENAEKLDETPEPRLHIPDPEHMVELATLKPGEYFGEISTFIELPRAATITAVTNVLMASISKTSFRTLYHTISPHLEADIEMIVKQHMLATLLQSKSPFLEVVDSAHAKEMATVTTISIIEKGAVIFKEDDKVDNFYFVYSGNLTITKKQRMIGSLYPGDYFGEMALMNDTDTRRATITATVKTVLLAVTRENFHACFEGTPQLMAEFKVRMQGSNVELQPLLQYAKSRHAFEEYLMNSNDLRFLSCHDDIEAYKSGINGEQAEQIVDMGTAFIEKYLISTSTSYIAFPQQEVIGFEVELSLLKSSAKEAACTAVSNLQGSKASILRCISERMRTKLESELLPAFKQSETFETLRKQLRAYDELDKQFMA